jgi:hypothetical protein
MGGESTDGLDGDKPPSTKSPLIFSQEAFCDTALVLLPPEVNIYIRYREAVVFKFIMPGRD